MRRAFERHRAADMDVGGLDLALGEAEAASRSKPGIGELLGRCRASRAEVLAERPLVEDELDVEGGRQRLLDRRDLLVGEALALERGRG